MRDIILVEIKNKWRLLFKTIKIYWVPLVCILVAALFSLYYAITAVLGISVGTPLDNRYVLYLFLAIISFFFYRIFFCKQPIVKLFSATLQYTYNTKCFRKILQLKYLAKIVSVLLVCFLLAFIVSGFAFGYDFLVKLMQIGGFSIIGYALSWIVFHNKRSKLLNFCMFVVCSLLLVVPHIATTLVLFLTALITNLYVGIYFNEFDIVKYSNVLIKADKVESAAARNDYAEMFQLAEENRSQTIVGFDIFKLSLNRNTAFIYKSMIELVRTQKSVLIISLLFLALGILVGKSNILDYILPFEIQEGSLFIATYLFSSALITMNNEVVNHYNNILAKHRLGLFVPIAIHSLMVQYLVPLVIINVAFSFVIGALFKKSLLVIIFVLFSTCCLSALMLLSQKMSRTKKKIGNLVLSIGFFLIIMLFLLINF